jgi:hypothetical protein
MTALELIHDLWAERPQTCCLYVKHGERGCYCRNQLVCYIWVRSLGAAGD